MGIQHVTDGTSSKRGIICNPRVPCRIRHRRVSQKGEHVIDDKRGKTYTTARKCGKHVASAKRGKTCLLTSAKRGKSRNMHCYARENITGARRGKKCGKTQIKQKQKNMQLLPNVLSQERKNVAIAKHGKTRLLAKREIKRNMYFYPRENMRCQPAPNAGKRIKK